jgi:hypothetical protein
LKQQSVNLILGRPGTSGQSETFGGRTVQQCSRKNKRKVLLELDDNKKRQRTNQSNDIRTLKAVTTKPNKIRYFNSDLNQYYHNKQQERYYRSVQGRCVAEPTGQQQKICECLY